MNPLAKTVVRGEPGELAYWDGDAVEIFTDELGKVPAAMPQVADAQGRIVVWVRERDSGSHPEGENAEGG